MTALERVFQILGSQKALADALGLQPPSIYEWKLRGVPSERCLEIERLTGGEVTRFDLRPDVFGDSAA